jgi:signal transduction histidine kinase
MNEPRGNILVIDDEVGMREGCRRALSPQGFHVDIAEHGVEGLHKLRQRPYDLILLDAMMPGMSGLELLERIRAHDPDTICVMITGYATVDLAAQAMKEGAHDFLPKPFTSDELLAVVESGLQERERRLSLRQQQALEEESVLLERTKQEIAKLDAIESRFMLVIVHELRNPAGAIKNYLQLMRAGYVDEDEWDDYLESLDLRASQLLNMLDDLLELAHLKQTANPASLNPVVVSDLLQEVTDKFQPLAEAEGLGFDVQVQPGLMLAAQPAHLRSLWTHLVDNAVRYTPHGRIMVTLEAQEGQLISKIGDTGIGISNEELSRIFQEFYRSEAAKAEVELGTGLGLPIVDQIVKIYQGTILVDSAPGEGATFTVRLPHDVSGSGM